MFESGGDNGHVIMMIRLFEMPSKKCKFGGYSQRGGTSFPQFGQNNYNDDDADDDAYNDDVEDDGGEKSIDCLLSLTHL